MEEVTFTSCPCHRHPILFTISIRNKKKTYIHSHSCLLSFVAVEVILTVQSFWLQNAFLISILLSLFTFQNRSFHRFPLSQSLSLLSQLGLSQWISDSQTIAGLAGIIGFPFLNLHIEFLDFLILWFSVFWWYYFSFSFFFSSISISLRAGRQSYYPGWWYCFVQTNPIQFMLATTAFDNSGRPIDAVICLEICIWLSHTWFRNRQWFRPQTESWCQWCDKGLISHFIAGWSHTECRLSCRWYRFPCGC